MLPNKAAIASPKGTLDEINLRQLAGQRMPGAWRLQQHAHHHRHQPDTDTEEAAQQVHVSPVGRGTADQAPQARHHSLRRIRVEVTDRDQCLLQMGEQALQCGMVGQWIPWIRVGRVIGGGPTLALLVLESMLGAWIVKREGARTWAALQEALTTGQMPSRQLADAALVLIGGTLLLTPGFVTDLSLIHISEPTRPY